MVFLYFKSHSKACALIWFIIASFVLVPWMLVLNLWGNIVIEEMDNTPNCDYSAYAQSYQMMYLIATYCIVFVYMIFVVTIRETMKRYYS